jgi:hypothetical protein
MFLIARFEYNSDSDKTIILSSLALVVLIIFNLLLGLFGHLDKKPFFKHYYCSALLLVITAVVLLCVW